MSDTEHSAAEDALERLEWSDERSGDGSRAAQITRRLALTGSAAGLAAALLEACGSSADSGTAKAPSAAGPLNSIFGVKGGYRFTFVNHATANTFFTPTINGIQDACRLLNCSYAWTGSTSTNVAQMATAISAAVSARVDGIATSLISPSLAGPVAAATRAGIPVISYNADEPGTTRLAYIGQNLILSGRAMGERIRQLIPHGGRIAVFIATPGSANLQPRLDGVRQALAGSHIEVTAPASGAGEAQELRTIQAFVGRHQTNFSGYFAVDAGSTSAVASAIQTYNLKGKVVGGGFDLTPGTETLLADNTIQFAIDQQPYLQGFLPVLELFLYRATQGLTGTADVDTGLRFLDPKTVRPYTTTSSRYEGTGTAAGVQKG